MEKRENRNFYRVEDLLGEAARMTKTNHYHKSDLYSMLREVAMKGCPAEFKFNYHLIHYNIKDECGIFKLHWVVVNGISGRQKIFFTKDFINDNGSVMWRRLAGEMNKV